MAQKFKATWSDGTATVRTTERVYTHAHRTDYEYQSRHGVARGSTIGFSGSGELARRASETEQRRSSPTYRVLHSEVVAVEAL